MGPGATGEEQLRVVVAGLGGLLLGILTVDAPRLATTVLAILSLDVVAGLVANLNPSGKAWWHRPGRGPGAHAGFVAVHAVHLALFASFFRGGDVRWLLTAGTLLALGTAAVLAVPPHWRRGTGLGALLVAMLLLQQTVGTVREAAWFLPLLYAKLFVAYLPPPLAGAPDPGPDR